MATTKQTIDSTHSAIGFKLKHMMLTNVSGKFNAYEGTIETDENDFTNAKISFSADIASVDTRNTDRDNHLKSDAFFDAENYPKLTFTGK